MKKLTLKCPNDHIFSMRYNNFQQGKRCPICIKNNVYKGGSVPYTMETIRTNIERIGYVLLSTEYKNALNLLQIKCPNNHIFSMRWNDLQQGRRCPDCANDEKRLIYNNVKRKIEDRGFELISKNYVRTDQKLQIKCCKCGHVFTKSFFCFNHQISPCPRHRKDRSFYEKEIVSLVKSIYDGVIVENDRTIVKNPITNRMLELDIYLPDIKKAIEFNGTYWHSDENTKQKDIQKIQQCSKRGIKLLVVTDTEWKRDKDIIKNIKNFIKKD